MSNADTVDEKALDSGPALADTATRTELNLLRANHQRRWLVGIISIAALTVFIAQDAFRMWGAAEEQMALSARLLAADMAAVDATSAPSLLPFLRRDLPTNTKIHITDAQNRLVAATEALEPGAVFARELALKNQIFSTMPVAGGVLTVFTSIDRLEAVTPLWGNAAAGLGFAILITGLVGRTPAQRKRSAVSAAEQTNKGHVLQALPMGVALWSSDGTLLEANCRYQELLNFDAEQLDIGATYEEVMAHATKGTVCELIDDNTEGRVSRITRDNLAYLIDERPLPEGGFITLVTDVSSFRATELALETMQQHQRDLAQQLREEKIRAESASRAKTSFLAHLSHDVRTPLNHIIGFADLIAHQTYGPVGDRRYLNYVRDIKGSGEKLLASFAEILELAQLEGGHLVMRRERFNISELVSATVGRFNEKAQRAGVSLDLSAPSDIALYADRLCVERMLGNIVENAIQFTPVGGRVTIAAWTADDGVVLEISDTGIGITEDRLIDLSQPFVLGDAAFTRESTGVGLGIAISRAIAELSGGRLAIDSSPAVGTTVAISLPLRATNARRLANAA